MISGVLMPIIGKGLGQFIGLVYVWARDWFDARWVRRAVPSPVDITTNIFYDKAFIASLVRGE